MQMQANSCCRHPHICVTTGSCPRLVMGGGGGGRGVGRPSMFSLVARCGWNNAEIFNRFLVVFCETGVHVLKCKEVYHIASFRFPGLFYSLERHLKNIGVTINSMNWTTNGANCALICILIIFINIQNWTNYLGAPCVYDVNIDVSCVL